MSEAIDDSRERAQVTEHHIENTAYTKYPGNYVGDSDEWNLAHFKKSFKAKIVEYKNGRELEIDLIGIGSAIANAYRRIMIAEVPTVAIEHCLIYNNTSVIQDEMLAHRLGMIPIKVDPLRLAWKPPQTAPDATSPAFTAVFTLKAKCEKNPDADPDKTGKRDELYTNYKVYSGQMVWVPLGDQEKTLGQARPVHKNILVAKLSGNQEIDLKLHAVKGIGRDHIKFSPVATASYRLMPDIKLLGKISGEAGLRLKESFSPGVISLSGKDKNAKVSKPRIDSGSRNVFRHADLKDKVKYDLLKEHFIFKIESTGAIPAIDILLQSCDILEAKCQYFIGELEARCSRIDECASVVESI